MNLAMSESVQLDIQLNAFVRPDTRSRWIAVCPKIDVVTQGTSEEDAKRCLDEAVQLWFEDCIERGTLEQALRECDFRTATREEAFSIRVKIPAYEPAVPTV